jgi:putative phage-type endonuclease
MTDMHREFILPRDEQHWHALRAQDLTSTDIAALFGMSPYATAIDVWHNKRDGVTASIPDNERMKWGRRLESVVARGIAEDQGWLAIPFKEYGRIMIARIGSSFDFMAINAPPPDYDGLAWFPEKPKPGVTFLLEIKTVDALAYRNGLTVEDDFIEAPAHIELQLQHQLLVSGLRVGYIGALIGGNRVELLRREADDEVHAAILKRAAEFWRSIKAGTPPPVVTADDARAFIRRATTISPGTLLDWRGDAEPQAMLSAYQDAKRAAKEAEDAADVLKAELLARIGDAERVMWDGGTISCGYTAGSPGTTITADMVGTTIGARAGYRQFRVNSKRGKA